MNSSKLKPIFEDNSNSEIKVKDLQCVKINELDKDNVKKVTKSISNNLLWMTFVAFSFVALFGALIYADFENVIQRHIIEIMFIFTLFLGLMALFIYFTNQMIRAKLYKYKKAQYGIVKNKYIFQMPSKKNTGKSYYINVLFPESNTFIARVECTKKVYDKLTEGSPVLVIAFDNYCAYAIPVNSIS